MKNKFCITKQIDLDIRNIYPDIVTKRTKRGSSHKLVLLVTSEPVLPDLSFSVREGSLAFDSHHSKKNSYDFYHFYNVLANSRFICLFPIPEQYFYQTEIFIWDSFKNLTNYSIQLTKCFWTLRAALTRSGRHGVWANEVPHG